MIRNNGISSNDRAEFTSSELLRRMFDEPALFAEMTNDVESALNNRGIIIDDSIKNQIIEKLNSMSDKEKQIYSLIFTRTKPSDFLNLSLETFERFDKISDVGTGSLAPVWGKTNSDINIARNPLWP